MPWPTFWVEETGEQELSLRRFTWSSSTDLAPCANGEHYHNALVPVGRAPEERAMDEHGGHVVNIPVETYDGDPRWPTVCEACPYEFRPEDERQVSSEGIYRRPDTGEEWRQRALPVGALFDSWWAPPNWRNPTDGLALTVVLPPDDGGDSRSRFWNIDGPASHREEDPDRPGEQRTRLIPHAWTRTGDHRSMPPTVSATPSIDTGTYHSFLTDGVLGDG